MNKLHDKINLILEKTYAFVDGGFFMRRGSVYTNEIIHICMDAAIEKANSVDEYEGPDAKAKIIEAIESLKEES